MVFVQKLAKVLGLCLLLIKGCFAQAAASIVDVRSWSNSEHTRYVLDMSGPAQAQISPDSTPGQVIIDVSDGSDVLPEKPVRSRGVVQKAILKQVGGHPRLILDVRAQVRPTLFSLQNPDHSRFRIVLDLVEEPPLVAPSLTPASVVPSLSIPMPAASSSTAAMVAPALLPKSSPGSDSVGSSVPTDSSVATDRASAPVETDSGGAGRAVIVAIDAGHGGQDTGAIGPGRIFEKNVTLAIARDIKALMEQMPGLHPVLTRNGDYFIPLAERREIARQHYHADIFISIHADASPSPDAVGASVFALSLKGANTATSRFARALAERENSADAVGGIHVSEHDGVLANVLADMVVEGSLEHSLWLGQNILHRISGFSPLHSHHVEQAGFAVLKEPGMVSLLVENGFITNPDEEHNLVEPQYQEKLAHAIVEGVDAYCRHYPLPGSWFAHEQEHDGQGHRGHEDENHAAINQSHGHGA